MRAELVVASVLLVVGVAALGHWVLGSPAWATRILGGLRRVGQQLREAGMFVFQGMRPHSEYLDREWMARLVRAYFDGVHDDRINYALPTRPQWDRLHAMASEIAETNCKFEEALLRLGPAMRVWRREHSWWGLGDRRPCSLYETCCCLLGFMEEERSPETKAIDTAAVYRTMFTSILPLGNWVWDRRKPYHDWYRDLGSFTEALKTRFSNMAEVRLMIRNYLPQVAVLTDAACTNPEHCEPVKLRNGGDASQLWMLQMCLEKYDADRAARQAYYDIKRIRTAS